MCGRVLIHGRKRSYSHTFFRSAVSRKRQENAKTLSDITQETIWVGGGRGREFCILQDLGRGKGKFRKFCRGSVTAREGATRGTYSADEHWITVSRRRNCKLVFRVWKMNYNRTFLALGVSWLSESVAASSGRDTVDFSQGGRGRCWDDGGGSRWSWRSGSVDCGFDGVPETENRRWVASRLFFSLVCRWGPDYHFIIVKSVTGRGRRGRGRHANSIWSRWWSRHDDSSTASAIVDDRCTRICEFQSFRYRNWCQLTIQRANYKFFGCFLCGIDGSTLLLVNRCLQHNRSKPFLRDALLEERNAPTEISQSIDPSGDLFSGESARENGTKVVAVAGDQMVTVSTELLSKGLDQFANVRWRVFRLSNNDRLLKLESFSEFFGILWRVFEDSRKLVRVTAVGVFCKKHNLMSHITRIKQISTLAQNLFSFRPYNNCWTQIWCWKENTYRHRKPRFPSGRCRRQYWRRSRLASTCRRRWAARAFFFSPFPSLPLC